MLAALKMVSDRGPVVESAPDSGDRCVSVRRHGARRLETEDPAMKLMQEQVERAEAKNAALEKEKAASRRAGCRGDDGAPRPTDFAGHADAGQRPSMAELGVLEQGRRPSAPERERIDAAAVRAGLAQQLDELVATPRAKPELALIKRRRVSLLEVAKWTRSAQQRLEHFNSFETNPLLQSWFAIVWPLQTLPLEAPRSASLAPRLIQGHIDENWAKARRLDDLATRIAAARLAADDGRRRHRRDRRDDGARHTPVAKDGTDGDGGFDAATPSSFDPQSAGVLAPPEAGGIKLIHLGACDITNKYNLKRQCFYSLVNFLTSSEDVAKGLLAASTVSLSGRQHHAVSSDAAQEIKQGEIQKSMGPKFGVAKVLIHCSTTCSRAPASTRPTAPVELAVPALRDDDDLSADGDGPSPPTDAGPRSTSPTDDDDARLRADAEARAAT
ncbi:hypothetical protein JL722_14991 [Aureococcus anophagefferens]|nr:hypothetical protein JL722_14991 [Aureococcus anophagefferens]